MNKIVSKHGTVRVLVQDPQDPDPMFRNYRAACSNCSWAEKTGAASRQPFGGSPFSLITGLAERHVCEL